MELGQSVLEGAWRGRELGGLQVARRGEEGSPTVKGMAVRGGRKVEEGGNGEGRRENRGGKRGKFGGEGVDVEGLLARTEEGGWSCGEEGGRGRWWCCDPAAAATAAWGGGGGGGGKAAR